MAKNSSNENTLRINYYDYEILEKSSDGRFFVVVAYLLKRSTFERSLKSVVDVVRPIVWAKMPFDVVEHARSISTNLIDEDNNKNTKAIFTHTHTLSLIYLFSCYKLHNFDWGKKKTKQKSNSKWEQKFDSLVLCFEHCLANERARARLQSKSVYVLSVNLCVVCRKCEWKNNNNKLEEKNFNLYIFYIFCYNLRKLHNAGFREKRRNIFTHFYFTINKLNWKNCLVLNCYSLKNSTKIIN